MFVKTLGVYLRDETETDLTAEIVSFLIVITFRKVFKSMFNLGLDKKYTLELLDVIGKQEQQQ